MHLYSRKWSIKWPCFWTISCTGMQRRLQILFCCCRLPCLLSINTALWSCGSTHMHTLFWWPLSLLLFLTCVLHVLCVCAALCPFGYIPPVSSSSCFAMWGRILSLFSLCLAPELPQHQHRYSVTAAISRLSPSSTSHMPFLLLFSISSVPSPSRCKLVKV